MAENKKLKSVSNSAVTKDAAGKHTPAPVKDSKPVVGPGSKSSGKADNKNNDAARAGGGQPTVIPGMPWWFPAIVAVLVLSYFGWLHFRMFDLASTADATKVWERSWMLFVSIEAIALAAAGAVLGVQIQRGRVQAAENRAEKAEDAIEDANQSALEAGARAEKLNARAEAYVAALEQEEAVANPTSKQQAIELARNRSVAARRILLDE